MLGEFLKARRALVSPEEAGLPDLGRRRVPGLRREELAMLAGVSADYYVRLEQGRDRHPSEQVLDALGRALRLDEAEAEHLRRLANPPAPPRRRRRRAERVSPVLLRLLDGWAAHPAFVLGRRMDVLAANPLATALHIHAERNMVRSVFLEPGARDFYPDWDAVAKDTVATLRGLADLEDPGLIELVGELSVRSPEFARLWARHDVRFKADGVKRIRHPLLGVIELEFESLAVNSAPGQLIVAYSAPPGSDSERALALLSTL
jgi:transcriptional regulator with XRE-family HTH domain